MEIGGWGGLHKSIFEGLPPPQPPTPHPRMTNTVKHPKRMKVEHFVQKVYAKTNRVYKWRVSEADLGLRFVNSVIMLHPLPRANASEYVLSIYNLLVIF